MNDDYKRGLVTGLAMQPLCVTSGADIVKFGTHNLLTDSGVTFGTQYTIFSVSGELCMCTIKACSESTNWWYKAIGGLSFKSGYMYKLVASKYDGYGRFGITNQVGTDPFSNVGRNAYGILPFDPSVPSDGDNHVLQRGWLTSQFYIGRNSSGYAVTSTSGELWFCTDKPFNSAKTAHSFKIALFEEVKS
jgi:hypothetical protein